jgi:anti-sigma factor RsiW
MDDIQLMAYVDGELTQREREDVEQAMRASPEIAERVALFSASALPYQHAFAHQKLPPVPERLSFAFAQPGGAYLAAQDATSRANPAHVRTAMRSPFRIAPGLAARFSLPGLAAAFAAGALSCALVLHFAVDGPHSEPAAITQSQHLMAANVSPWVAAAVTYQQLYTRDTVAFDALTPEVASQVIAQIHSDDGVMIRVPDLRAAGLTFTRIQRLRFHNRPLVQIVYLPKTGLPVALCVMKDDKPDATMIHQHVESMNVLTWRRANLSYALIASVDDDQLMAIGKQISRSMQEEALGQLSLSHATTS